MPTGTEKGDYLVSSRSYRRCRPRDGNAGLRANVTGNSSTAIIVHLACAFLASHAM